MRTNFSPLIVVVVAIATSCHSAHAGIVGMLLHLKAAIDLNELDFQATLPILYR